MNKIATMLFQSFPALFVLSLIASGINEVWADAPQELCTGPVEVAQIVNVEARPSPDAATEVDLILRSGYPLDAYLWMNGAPVILGDDGHFNLQQSQNGELVISLASRTPMDTSSLYVSIQATHPCNGVVVSLYFTSLLGMFKQGIPFPVVSEMPKRGYKLTRLQSNLLLRYSIQFSENHSSALIPQQIQSAFSPRYLWKESNILLRLEDMDLGARASRNRPNEEHIRMRNWDTTKNGTVTLTSEFGDKFGSVMPMDGAVISSMFYLKVNLASLSRSDPLFIFSQSTVQFLEQEDAIPIGVEALAMESPLKLIAQEKRAGFTMLTVVSDHQTPVEKRGLRCLAAGSYTAPVVSVARIPTPDFKNETADGQTVDQLFPGASLGTVGYAEFKIDPPLGSEEYYVCSASMGKEVTSIIIKVVSQALP